MKIRKTDRFEVSFKSLPDDIKKKMKKALELLLTNPRHPSLRIKKLKSSSDVWYGRIDNKFCFTFEKAGDVLIMRQVGVHNSVIDKP